MANALDILVTSRRDAHAATRFLRKLLTGLQYVPRVLVTDKLASYGVAHRRLDDRPIRHLERGNWHGHSRLITTPKINPTATPMLIPQDNPTS
jgi:transposase-like protein